MLTILSVHGIVTQLKNAYLAGIRIVKHEKVFCRFHLESQGILMKKGINLMLTRRAIRIFDNPPVISIVR